MRAAVKIRSAISLTQTVVPLEEKLDAVGYGFFIPVFFVASGMTLDAQAIVKDPLRLLIFLVLLVVRGVKLASRLQRGGADLVTRLSLTLDRAGLHACRASSTATNGPDPRKLSARRPVVPLHSGNVPAAAGEAAGGRHAAAACPGGRPPADTSAARGRVRVMSRTVPVPFPSCVPGVPGR
ncbi:MAG TPA: cation:proton antiporter [Streptosporangiaceae bacterium]|nr:cation:proton antiporter [Streptosporangiaceae bacterium]